MHSREQAARRAAPLDGQTRLLLAVNGLMATANALSGTYLGVYLWKADNSFMPVAWFTLFTHLLAATTFWIAGNWAKEGNKMTVLRLGIATSAVFYALALLLGTRAAQYVWLLGAVQGLAFGFFWLAFNVVYFEVTNAGNRDRFNGLTGVTASIVGMTAPWCSGYFLSRTPGISGYRIVFAVSLAIFVAGFVCSFRLRRRPPDSAYDWRMPIRTLLARGTPWKPVLAALAAQGLRESIFGVAIGLLVYISTGSELQLGNFAVLTSAIGFAGFYAAGRWLKPAWRSAGMLIGACAVSAAVVPFFFGVGFGSLLLFGAIVALFFPLYAIPMTSSVFDLIGRDEDSVKRRVEYVVLRELALNAGRIVGMIAFMITLHAGQSPLALHSLLFATGCSPLLSWYWMRARLDAPLRRAPEPVAGR